MEVVIVGRSPSCNFVFDDPYVSREHVQIIKYSEDKFAVIDIDSTTGTYINGQKATKGVEKKIEKTDIIKIGNTLLKWNDFFKKPKIVEPPSDIYKTTPDQKSLSGNVGNENVTLPEELMKMIEDFAEDGIYSDGEKTALISYCSTNSIDYDSLVLPALTDELDKANKKKTMITEMEKTATSNFIYASFGKRLGAALLDGILSGVFAGIFAALVFFASFDALDFGNSDSFVFANITVFIILWLYWAVQESSKSQATIGKRAVDIKIIDKNGDKISFARASGRFLGKFISSAILLIGYLMPLWTEKKQTLHDMMAECYVVEK